MTVRLPAVLSIGGSDSCCGAGIQADLKTFQFMGVYGATAITAVTAQNTRSVSDVFPLPAGIISAQIASVVSDLRPAAIKTGMLHNSEAVSAVCDGISGCGNIVVDPVIVSETGRRLLEEDAVDVLRKKLLPLADLAAPNVFEAEALSGIRIRSLSDAKKAAKKIAAKSVIIKGGHLRSKTDVLYHGGKITVFRPSFIFEGRMHGRGCCFSAAVAAGLAKGLGIPDAISCAKSFVDRAILCRASPGKGLSVANAEADVHPAAANDGMDEAGHDNDACRIRGGPVNGGMRASGRGPIAGRVRGGPAGAELKRILDLAVSGLSGTKAVVLLPEVGSNLVCLLPGASSLADVAGIDGRMRKGKGGIVFGSAEFGASTHMASALLAANKLDASITCAMNILHTPRIFAACRKAGLVVGVADRSDETPSVRSRDGASMPWAIRQAYKKQGRMPEVIFHTGAFGKEPLLLVFGSCPDDVVLKVKRILESGKWLI